MRGLSNRHFSSCRECYVLSSSVIVSWFSYEAFANISAGDIHGTTAHFYESAMKRYGTRWLGVWSRFDEALAGLSSTLQELNVKWIPNTLFRRRTWPWGPEWAHLAIFHVILFANGIARLVAPFGDRLISRFLLRTAQGNDLPGSFVLQGVTHTPIGLVAGGPDLPEDVEGELIDSANRRAAALIPNARQVFCQLALEGVAIAQTLQASGLALAEGSLVHTSYFENEQILDLIGMHVARHSLLDRGEKVPFRPIKLEQWFNEWQRHIETVISRLP